MPTSERKPAKLKKRLPQTPARPKVVTKHMTRSRPPSGSRTTSRSGAMAADPRPVMADSGVWSDLHNGRSTPAALLLT